MGLLVVSWWLLGGILSVLDCLGFFKRGGCTARKVYMLSGGLWGVIGTVACVVRLMGGMWQ